MKRTTNTKNGVHLCGGAKCLAAHSKYICEHGMPKKEKRARSGGSKLAIFADAYKKDVKLRKQIVALSGGA